jgi:V/A-type H+/Na+-transporting ATPase subunit K
MLTKIILVIALILSIIVPFGAYLIGEKNKGRFRTSLGVNAFFLLWNINLSKYFIV